MWIEMSEKTYERIINAMAEAQVVLLREANGDMEKLRIVNDLSLAMAILQDRVEESGIDTDAYRKSQML